MINFTIWGQTYKPLDKKLPELKKENIQGKLHLLEMYENELRYYFRSKDEESNRRFQIEIAAVTMTITILLTLIGNIFLQMIRDMFLTLLVLEASIFIYFCIKVMLDLLNMNNRNYKNIVIRDPQFFLNLLKKIKEKWYVSSITNWWPVYFSVTTESDRKDYKKGEKRHENMLKKKTRDIDNPVSISEIVKNKDLYVNKKITLNCFSFGHSSISIPNGYYNDYKIYDKTGGISAILFKTKKYFWQKAPKIEDERYGDILLKTEFYYRVTGTWIKANNLYWLQLQPSKVESLISHTSRFRGSSAPLSRRKSRTCSPR